MDLISRKKILFCQKLFIYFSLFLLSVFAFFPILWMVLTSIKIPSEMYKTPPQLVPSSVTLQNYLYVFKDNRMMRYILNTFFVSTMSTLIAIFFGSMSGYVFARYSFKIKKPLFFFVFASMLIPMTVLIVPLYITFLNMGLVDSYQGLILAYLIRTLPVAVWLFHGFFLRIPMELEEAAMVDGCTRVKAIIKILVPILMPGIIAVSVYVFLVSWKMYLFPLVLTTASNVRPLSVGLVFYIGETNVLWGQLMAASTLVSLPPTILFLIFQKRLTAGLAEGAIKG